MIRKEVGIEQFVPPRALYQDIVRAALMEDVGHGDITTACTIDPEESTSAKIVAKEPGVLAGLFVAREAFLQMDPEARFPISIAEGTLFDKGSVLLEIRAGTNPILMAERVALNFLQRLCGIATLARQYCRETEGTKCRVVGTRKTTPNMRILEKYAVRAGGCLNHRFSLSDGILIKDNHIAACGNITRAVQAARQNAPHGLKIEVEVTSQEEMKEAVAAGADAILLDNMDPAEIREALQAARQMAPSILVEASGGITLKNVRQFAETGVDILSSGELTHSFKSIDLSLKIKL